jgi:tRNA pseudouridine55 synthase
MPSETTIRSTLPSFTGELLQVPPMASAIKREGVRLYDLHRRGVTIEREPRPVTVHAFDLVATDPTQHTATFEISCSSGTYVRTLIADLADRLHTGAYLTALRRTRVGHLPVESAVDPDHLTPKSIYNHIIHPDEVISHLPRVEVDCEEELAVRSGRTLRARGLEGSFRVEWEGALLAVYRDDGAEARAEVVLCGEGRR